MQRESPTWQEIRIKNIQKLAIIVNPRSTMAPMLKKHLSIAGRAVAHLHVPLLLLSKTGEGF
jgi:hypothetical protein